MKATTHSNECVVLLHGWNSSPLMMKPAERFFRREGWTVVNLSYPSVKVPLTQLADEYLPKALRERLPSDASRVHFVTHSMGGIVVRQYLARHSLTNLGRVVMLGPPNQGSERADELMRFSIIRHLCGPNLMCLGTNPDKPPRNLGPMNFECGIIAGERRMPGFIPTRLPKPHDGIVSVASTRAQGMTAHLVVSGSHTFLPWRQSVLESAAYFLRHGMFETTE